MDTTNTKDLFTAFIKFQQDFKGLKPDASNPFFKSSYITLDGILLTIRPILSKYGLAVLQNAFSDGEFMCVQTMLIHESGQSYITDTLKMRPQKIDAQQNGSMITYMKRYQLGALVGVSDIDDDGNMATFQKSKPDTTQTVKPKQIDQNRDIMIPTDAQIKRFYALLKQANKTKDEVFEWYSKGYKKDLKSVGDMDINDYNLVCKALEGKITSLKEGK